MEIYEETEVTDFWKPEPGLSQVKVLTEKTAKLHDNVKDEDYEVLQLEVEIKQPLTLAGKKKTWNVRTSENPTKISLFGQLLIFAKANKNTLVGCELEIVKAGEGKATRYTVRRLL